MTNEAIKIKVNGEERTLHWTVHALTYDRVVNLSGMPYRRDYLVHLVDTTPGAKPTRVFSEPVPLVPMNGLAFTVERPPRRNWFQWLTG